MYVDRDSAKSFERMHARQRFYDSLGKSERSREAEVFAAHAATERGEARHMILVSIVLVVLSALLFFFLV